MEVPENEELDKLHNILEPYNLNTLMPEVNFILIYVYIVVSFYCNYLFFSVGTKL